MTDTKRVQPPEGIPLCGDWSEHGQGLASLGTCPRCDDARRGIPARYVASLPCPPDPVAENADQADDDETDPGPNHYGPANPHGISPVRERFGVDLPPPAVQPAPTCRLCGNPARAGGGGILCEKCYIYSEANGLPTGAAAAQHPAPPAPSVADVDTLILMAAARLAEGPSPARTLAILRALALGAGAVAIQATLEPIRVAVCKAAGELGESASARNAIVGFAVADLAPPTEPPRCNDSASHHRAIEGHGRCQACIDARDREAGRARP